MEVTERPRSLNPSKAIVMAIYPIIVHFSTWRARSMHDVACEFAHAVVRSKDAQKQLARTSLNLLFRDVLVPVVVDCFSSLILNERASTEGNLLPRVSRLLRAGRSRILETRLD